eukprot:1158690-Pelagomonas_calceolata.AAC.2
MPPATLPCMPPAANASLLALRKFASLSLQQSGDGGLLGLQSKPPFTTCAHKPASSEPHFLHSLHISFLVISGTLCLPEVYRLREALLTSESVFCVHCLLEGLAWATRMSAMNNLQNCREQPAGLPLDSCTGGLFDQQECLTTRTSAGRKTLYVWHGDAANLREKSKSLEVANTFRSNRGFMRVSFGSTSEVSCSNQALGPCQVDGLVLLVFSIVLGKKGLPVDWG